jgi:hypothetical protein
MSDHHFWLSDAQFARLVSVRPHRPAARSAGPIASALDSGHYGAVDDASDEAALDGRGEAVDLPSDDDAGRFRRAGRAALRDERQHDLQMAARSSLYA